MSRALLRRHAAVVVTSLALGACSVFTSPPRTPDPSTERQVVVEVNNHNWLAVRVYAVRNGARFRVGVVDGATDRLLTLPRGWMETNGQVQLLIDPIGGLATHLTEPIPVCPGQRIEIQVEADVALTSFIVLTP